MVPVFLSLTGTGLSSRDKLFIGWFGPRGLASIVFTVIALNEGVAGGGTLAATAVWTIVLSVVAHGLTAGPFAAALAKHESFPSTG
jgi:NhaP-type Na+/H+ or K+/H+ antiporter